jgi:hypothetical protein
MAARSFYIEVLNSGPDLNRQEEHLAHGIWTEGRIPPEHIPNRSRAHWQSESQGFATGTEGWVRYGFQEGDVKIWWNNPFVGSNNFGVDYDHDKLEINWGDTSGNNAAVTVTILEKF